MKDFFGKYSHLKSLLYFFVCYMIGFSLLEKWNPSRVIVTDSFLDQYIPFNEYFVIPYVLWFAFIALGFMFFAFKDRENFNRVCFYMFWGMGICLLIYLVFPSQQNLRVELSNTNIFQTMVSYIYSVDTPTNVCPSIHAYNSIMMCIALYKSKKFKKHKVWMGATAILSFMICLSTVMIKQHAIVDVICAIVLSIVIYMIGKIKYGY